jgi:hypothetical protein
MTSAFFLYVANLGSRNEPIIPLRNLNTVAVLDGIYKRTSVIPMMAATATPAPKDAQITQGYGVT